MKIFLLLTGVLMTVYMSQAQVLPAAYANTMKVNYIRTWDAKAPAQDSATLVSLPVTGVTQTTQYFDGLGRPLQMVTKQMSPLGKDLVTPVIYDAYGREQYKYLPFAANVAVAGDVVNDGNFKLDPFQQQAAFYSTSNAGGPLYQQGETFYYAQINYETSPLNRILTAYGPGNSWVGSARGVSSQYLANAAGDSVRIWNIAAAAGSLPTSTAVYGAGLLYKNGSTDEQGHQVYEYKDKEGHVILKKVKLWNTPAAGHSGWLCTYYVYDDLGNQRFVIPPKAVEWLVANSWNFSAGGGTGVVNELCFRYEYDARNRGIIKKVPGADEEWMIYDSRDRLVLSQNAILRGQGKWLFTKYDASNRPVVAGLYQDATHNSQASMQAYLNTQNMALYENYQTATYPLYSLNQSFPVVAFADVLTFTYYDDYSWSGWYGDYGSKDNSYDNRFSTSYSSYPYPQPLTQSIQTRGMIMGVWDASNSGLLTATYYDDHGRPIQTKQYNWTGGVDIATTQYNFSGKPLQTYVRHQKMGTNAQTHSINTRLSYDQANRLKSVYKNIDSAVSDQLIDSMQYDELSQLRAKYLGNGLESLTYDYNVRGWMTEINKSYLTGASSHYFGMELAYDKTSAAIGTTSYLNAAFGGNISGTIWKSAGDGIGRKYDFVYDNVSRLVSANFLQNTAGSSWDNSSINYTVNNLAYDANGNILGMKQYGFKLGGSSPIDQLQYNYQLNSNKLAMVFDTANDQNSKLGDLHYNPSTKGATDYAYDNDGNLQSDNNKSITSITYNYLNQPLVIQINGKGSIQYWYDAIGNKMKKQVVDATVTPQKVTNTLYVGGVVYQNDTAQFMGHEEGRARWAFHKYTGGTTGYKWEYDFFAKDHLGNMRVLLSQQKDTARYLATMEGAYRNTENSLFYNIPTTAYARSSASGYPVDLSVTNPNDSVSRLNGSGQKVGPAIILKVMSGDSVVIGTNYYFNASSATNGQQLSASDLINALASGIVSATGGTHGSFSDLTGPSTPLTGALTSFINSNNGNTSGKPNAYLNWILLNNQFGYVSTNGQSGAQQVATAGATAGGGLQSPLGTSFKVKTSGYLYIYLSNATPNWDVFFDNLSITHYSGPMLEETHYYPFGLTMAGISDKALKGGYAENKYRYNGKDLQNKEFSDGTGLEEYDYGARSYDPQTGRWNSIDPKSDKFLSASPYSYVVNNPLLLNDPNGKDWSIVITQGADGKLMVQITVNAAVVNKSDKKIDLQKYIAGQMAAFSKIFSVNDKDFQVTATLNMRVIEKEGDVKGDEHLVVIGNESKFDKNVAGESYMGGLRVDLNSKYIHEDGTVRDNAVLSHEIGHTGGLDHPFEPGDNVELYKYSILWRPFFRTVSAYDQKKGVDLQTNFMSYPGKFIPNTPAGEQKLEEVRKNPGGATDGQISAILRYYGQGYLNKDDR